MKLKNLNYPDGSYSVSNIQDYFKYIIKKRETMTVNPPIRIYVNKLENSITFRIKTRYLETNEVVLVNCNIVNNDFDQDLRALFTFVPINRLVIN